MQVELGSSNKLDYVFQQLEKKIISGELKVGDQMLTENELAAYFNCSRGTVSKAVGRLVHEGLVERRTKVGTRVIRNSTTRTSPLSLKLDASALIFPGEQHEGIWRIERGFQGAAREAKRRVIMLTTGTDFRKEAEIIGRLSEFDVKGAVIYPVLADPADQVYFVQMISASRFPVVMVELNIAGFGRPAVVADGLHAGYTVTKHLLDQGLKKIGFLTNYAWVPFMRDRYQGYRQAMLEAGLVENSSHVLLEPSMRPSFEDPLAEPTRMAREFIRDHRDLEGIVCGNDWLAHGCLVAAVEAGISVPKEMKIIGIDDFRSLPHSDRLTTYHIPYEEMGREAFWTLETCFQGLTPAIVERQMRGYLVVRDSA
jgi:GntR family transcriptional regulator, arabinose operon transcriptional repressor